MAMFEVVYPIASKGLGTEFSESTRPSEYAGALNNRFINLKGEAETRPGVVAYGDSIGASGGATNKNTLHEFVKKDGSTILMGVSGGQVYVYDEISQSFDPGLDFWQDAFVDTIFFIDSIFNYEFDSVQMENKLIFYHPQQPPVYLDEKLNLFELKPLIQSGKAGTGTTANILKDTNITDWLNETYVGANDLVYFPELNAYGLITSVGASNLDFTTIGTTAGGTGNGIGSIEDRAPNPGDVYQIIDLVETNVIPVAEGFVSDFDNIALGATGTNSLTIVVSGVTLADNGLKVGDWAYNTTRAAIQIISDVSDNQAENPGYSVAGQTAGDSFAFFKSAIPYASYAHVHNNRLHLIDSKNRTDVVVSGPGDPQDFTTFQRTLSASTLSYGGKQSQGEELLSLATFQRYLVAAGKHAVYLDDGSQEISDVTANVVDLQTIGLFPYGVVSKDSLANLGGNMIYAANDGARQFNITNILAVTTDNISEAIKTEFRTALAGQAENPQNIRVIHYPRRNWVMFKVGDIIYNFNYTPVYLNGEMAAGGTWSRFTGLFADMDSYLLRANGDLLCVSNDGTVYQFDAPGIYTDDDELYPTAYKTAWLAPPDPGNRGIRVRDTRYIKPYFEAATEVVYTVSAQADLGTFQATSTVTVTASGGPQVGTAVVGTDPVGGFAAPKDQKLPLRLRGEQFKIAIKTAGGSGVDRISQFAIYGNMFGRE